MLCRFQVTLEVNVEPLVTLHIWAAFKGLLFDPARVILAAVELICTPPMVPVKLPSVNVRPEKSEPPKVAPKVIWSLATQLVVEVVPALLVVQLSVMVPDGEPKPAVVPLTSRNRGGPLACAAGWLRKPARVRAARRMKTGRPRWGARVDVMGSPGNFGMSGQTGNLS